LAKAVDVERMGHRNRAKNTQGKAFFINERDYQVINRVTETAYVKGLPEILAGADNRDGRSSRSYTMQNSC
jgi:hypothetical protein